MSVEEVTAPPGWGYRSMTGAAGLIGISPAWLRSLILKGKLDALQMRVGKLVYRWICRDDIPAIKSQYNTPGAKRRRLDRPFGKLRRSPLNLRCPRCGVICPQWRNGNRNEGRCRRKCSRCKRQYTPNFDMSRRPTPRSPFERIEW